MGTRVVGVSPECFMLSWRQGVVTEVIDGLPADAELLTVELVTHYSGQKTIYLTVFSHEWDDSEVEFDPVFQELENGWE